MNLCNIAHVIFALNMCFAPAVFSEQKHHHFHHLTHGDRILLMYGTREELVEGYSKKCDENYQLKSGYWQIKLFSKGVATGVILSASAAAIMYVCSR